jgi:hypothetical protein
LVQRGDRSFINYSSLAAERILKGIADNFAELINESTHFCSLNLEPKTFGDAQSSRR